MKFSENLEPLMKAMVMEFSGTALQERELPRPIPGSGQIQIHVSACAVCRTDLHVLDGELLHPKLPLIPGHEIVGRVSAAGPAAERFKVGTRVGVAWLGWTCGKCSYCLSDRENLCEKALFTGYTLNGGFAEYMVADQRFCFAIPETYPDAHAAPLLCAGLIGYRCLVKAGYAQRVGIYGFGAAAHIVCQLAHHQEQQIFAFTRPGDVEAQRFALSLGAVWAGDSTILPMDKLDAAIIFASDGDLVPLALESVAPGGIVVCGGIHMSDIPSFSYDILWRERTLCSVANLTRRDGEEFFKLISRVPVHTTIQTFPLSEANRALDNLRAGRLEGAAVLEMS